MAYFKSFFILGLLAFFGETLIHAQTPLPAATFTSFVRIGSSIVSTNEPGGVSTSFGGASATGSYDPNLFTVLYNATTTSASEEAQSSIQYYLEVYNPNVSSGLVPIDIRGSLNSAAFDTSATAESELSIGGNTFTASVSHPTIIPTSAITDLSTVGSLSLTVNTQYLVTLTADVFFPANSAAGSGFASIDPTFNIDSTFANPDEAYTLEFSPGFAAPEPSVWALLLSGMGLLLGFVARKSKTTLLS